jgi:hypothetical protein
MEAHFHLRMNSMTSAGGTLRHTRFQRRSKYFHALRHEGEK